MKDPRRHAENQNTLNIFEYEEIKVLQKLFLILKWTLRCKTGAHSLAVAGMVAELGL